VTTRALVGVAAWLCTANVTLLAAYALYYGEPGSG
jgi:hypothetical protein